MIVRNHHPKSRGTPSWRGAPVGCLVEGGNWRHWGEASRSERECRASLLVEVATWVTPARGLRRGLWESRGGRPPPGAPATKSRACPLVKPVREPDAGDPQVRFDERRWETELRPRLRHRHYGESCRQQRLPRPTATAPAADSTLLSATCFPHVFGILSLPAVIRIPTPQDLPLERPDSAFCLATSHPGQSAPWRRQTRP
jgi:hypothetical protein